MENRNWSVLSEFCDAQNERMIWLEEEVERLKSEIMSLEMIIRSAGGDTQVGLVVWCVVLDTVHLYLVPNFS